MFACWFVLHKSTAADSLLQFRWIDFLRWRAKWRLRFPFGMTKEMNRSWPLSRCSPIKRWLGSFADRSVLVIGYGLHFAPVDRAAVQCIFFALAAPRNSRALISLPPFWLGTPVPDRTWPRMRLDSFFVCRERERGKKKKARGISLP